MTRDEINVFLESLHNLRDRTIVIVDFGNVDKWKESLGWSVGIQELARLVKYFAQGKKFLRRFYYGADYGPDERSQNLTNWSRAILDRADMNGFTVIRKRVKYIRDQAREGGFDKKCDLDVEITIDLIKEKENYDTIILFSGDGDLITATSFLYDAYQKKCFVFGARNHIGREVYDAQELGGVEKILYTEDFEYRLRMNRFR